jgi:hypothetical protein
MAIVSSGAISLYDLKNEFGGPPSPSLFNYYAGRGYVPTGTANIPTDGTISLQQFYGASAVGIVNPLVSHSWQESNINTTNKTTSALCWINVYPDGTFTCLRGQAPNGDFNVHDYDGMWYSVATPNIGANYWIRATIQAGATNSANGSPDSPIGTWVSMNNAAASWGVVARTVGISQRQVKSVTILLEFSSSPSGNPIVTSGTYSMYAVVDPGA